MFESLNMAGVHQPPLMQTRVMLKRPSGATRPLPKFITHPEAVEHVESDSPPTPWVTRPLPKFITHPEAFEHLRALSQKCVKPQQRSDHHSIISTSSHAQRQGCVNPFVLCCVFASDLVSRWSNLFNIYSS